MDNELRQQLQDIWMSTSGVRLDGPEIDRTIALIATALQAERQRIADSLLIQAETLYISDVPDSIQLQAVPIEAVRAVLIPPMGKLGGLATPSETAESKDSKSITEASASEEER